MSAVCLYLAAAMTLQAALPERFTLAWLHSNERLRWEEDYAVVPAGLALVESRVQGSGAGMEPPEGSVLRDGWWRDRTARPPLPRLRLANSEHVAGYDLCWDGACRPLNALAPEAAGQPVILSPCRADAADRRAASPTSTEEQP